MAEQELDGNISQLILQSTRTTLGLDYFVQMGHIIQDLTKADYTFISRIDDKEGEAYPIVSYKGDMLIDNMKYALKNTPCADVVETCTAYIPAEVQELFPDDQILIDMKIHGYLGASIKTEGSDVPFAIIVCLYENENAFDYKYLRSLESIATMMEDRAIREYLIKENYRLIEEKKDLEGS